VPISVSADPSVQPDGVAGRFRLVSSRVALALGVALVIAMVAAAPLSILGGSGNGFFAVALLPFGIVGAAISWRQPWNPIGSVLLLLLALAVVASSDAGSYAAMVYRRGDHLPLGRLAVFLAPGAWIWLVALLPVPVALFPEGRLSRRWRWLLGVYLAGYCGGFLATAGWQNAQGALARHIRVDSSGQLASNSESGTSAADAVPIALYIGFGLVWLGRLLGAYRGSSGDYRQQLKWLLTGSAISITGLVLAVTTSGGRSLLAIVGGIGFIVSLLALPTGLGVGILKYRLYEIDRLISRTISYLLVTEATVTTFRTRLWEAVDLDAVRQELLRTVDGAVEPAHTSLWIRLSGTGPRR